MCYPLPAGSASGVWAARLEAPAWPLDVLSPIESFSQDFCKWVNASDWPPAFPDKWLSSKEEKCPVAGPTSLSQISADLSTSSGWREVVAATVMEKVRQLEAARTWGPPLSLRALVFPADLFLENTKYQLYSPGHFPMA